MKAEIVSVGTELLLGDVVNTDTTIVAKALAEIGVSMQYACTVGDNPQRLEQVLRDSLSRCDLVITTGGLGPTEDDLTKETIARVAGKTLVEDKQSLQRIVDYFKGRTCSENQYKQAMLPQGCYVLPNDEGTAPGCVCQTPEGKQIAMLPGPPAELRPMLENYLIPYLRGDDKTVILSRNIHVFGKGEGTVAQEIASFVNGENPTVATYAKEGEMYIRVTARAHTKEAAEALCAPVVKALCGIVGDYVYTTEYDSLAETVLHLLMDQGKTISTAESCTGGLIAKRITDLPGSSAVFEMGAVTYSNRIKTLLVDVPEDLLRQHGAVSEEVAAAMAQGVQKRSGSTLGVGVTGIAGPGGGSEEKPVGLVYVALSDGKETWVKGLKPSPVPRKRSFYRNRAASAALDMARRYLTGLPIV
ncbi:MAG: competence/damage-inducible protein A [Oscillospiraceae bacterium]|nr:competence/damage-inducible protein A [Oscillospiraceae bacterium]